MKPFTTTSPEISLLSPISQKYNMSSVPLLFIVDKSVNWTGYSLDGKQNVTVSGNSTIANMANALHSITFYTNDTFGNMGRSTISFDISKPESLSTAIVDVLVVLVVIVVVAGLLVYSKKHKHPRKFTFNEEYRKKVLEGEGFA